MGLIFHQKTIQGPYGQYISGPKANMSTRTESFHEQLLSPFSREVTTHGPSISPFLSASLTGAGSYLRAPQTRATTGISKLQYNQEVLRLLHQRLIFLFRRA